MLSPDTPVITGIGMATPLGTAKTACAAARAKLNGFKAIEGIESFDAETGDAVPIQGSAIEGSIKGFAGAGRFANLAEIALRDLEASVDDNFSFEQVPIILVVSNEYYWREAHNQDLRPVAESLPFDVDEALDSEIESRRQVIEEKILPNLASLSGVPINPNTVTIVGGGQAQFMAILQSIEQNMEAGNLNSCIVGAVDSLVDQRALDNILRLNLAQTAENPIGFIPGEASCFVLFERHHLARQRSADILGALSRSKFRQNEVHRFSDEPVTGALLADVILESVTVDQENVVDFGEMIGNVNGDIWRAKEFGAALTRLPEFIRNLPLLLPTQSFGETGAASAAVALAYGVHRLNRNCSHKDNILLWVSGDDGCKGSCILTKVR